MERQLSSSILRDEWNRLKEISKWASCKLVGKIAIKQADIQAEAKRLGINLD